MEEDKKWECHCPQEFHMIGCKFSSYNRNKLEMLIMSDGEESSLSDSSDSESLASDVEVKKAKTAPGPKVNPFTEKLVAASHLWGLPFTCDRVQKELLKQFKFATVLTKKWDKVQNSWRVFGSRGSAEVPNWREIVAENKKLLHHPEHKAYREAFERMRLIVYKDEEKLIEGQPKRIAARHAELEKLEALIEKKKIRTTFLPFGPLKQQQPALDQARAALDQVRATLGEAALAQLLKEYAPQQPQPRVVASQEAGTDTETIRIGRFVVPCGCSYLFYKEMISGFSHIERKEFEAAFEKACEDVNRFEADQGLGGSGHYWPSVMNSLRLALGVPRIEPPVHDGWTDQE